MIPRMKIVIAGAGGHGAIVADILGGATILAGGLSLYFTLSSGKSDAPKQGGAPSLKIAIAPQRLLLQGEF